MSGKSEETKIDVTHSVFNQPPPLVDHDPWRLDAPLREGVAREGGGWAEDELANFARRTASEEVLGWGDQANRFEPELRTHDRFGHRIDEVEFHPAWHQLMALGKGAEIHSLPWSRRRAGAHVVRAAKHYLLAQAEAGVLCPLTMTFAAVPALRAEPDVADAWVPRLLTAGYDPRLVEPSQKSGCTLGMAMTEKQGGSDVRANTTRAVAESGAGSWYRLTGHKWFCSAPMSDGFLTLAYVPENGQQDGPDAGLTCFLVPRILDDGSRNPFHIQRLKRKLGNRSNASSEIEYHGTWARRVGEVGRGVATIIEMVNHTRLDCVLGSAGLMRQALAQATHHAAHRHAFGRRLADQPLMRQVLADLALEVEAATALGLRLARAFDAEHSTEHAEPLHEIGADARHEASFRRVATAIGKYWVCKRGPSMVFEAMECLGGNGYVEESILPRLYREMPVNSIWEGSGNVMCLDVLRALQRDPACAEVLRQELEFARGSDSAYDHELDKVHEDLARPSAEGARRLVERLAVLLQASLLLRNAPSFVAEAFVRSRLGDGMRLFGTLPADVETRALCRRANPAE